MEIVGGVAVWALTGHQVLQEAIAHPDVRKEVRHWQAWQQGHIGMDWPLISWVAPDNMLTADGRRHRRLRTLVSKAFTQRRVEQLRPRVEQITAELLADLDTVPGPVDLKARLALPLPITVISELFGVPAQQRKRMHELMHTVFDARTTPEQAAQAHEDMQQFLADLARAKEDQPGDDLTSALLAARAEDEDRLSHTELVWTLVLMIGAGYETTMNLITNAVRALLEHPEQLAMAISGRLSWEAVVEETLRWDASIQYLPLRYTAAPVRLAGVTIPAGQALLMGLGAAGRDPEQHRARAEQFDATRSQEPNLAFSYGPHFCLGAALARLEATTALRMLFERRPHLRLADEPGTREPSLVASSWEQLLVHPGTPVSSSVSP